MLTASPSIPGLLRILGDPTRLRILALLEREELRVGELSRALGLSQSRTSNHLRVLREAGLLAERHVGKSTFLRHAAARRNGVSEGFPERLWTMLSGQLESLPEHAADLARLERVLAERSEGPEFFDRVAGEWDTIGVDFATGQARQRAVAALVDPGIVVADLGCGTGYMAAALIGIAAKVICVDRSEGMLAQAARRFERAPARCAVDLRAGELDALPLEDREVDAVLCGMVLHHVPRLDAVLAEMRRVLRPGGTAVVLELAPHREAWVRERLGDRHLGLEPTDVLAAFERAGFEDVTLEPADDRYRPAAPDGRRADLPLYLVRARTPRGANDNR